MDTLYYYIIPIYYARNLKLESTYSLFIFLSVLKICLTKKNRIRGKNTDQQYVLIFNLFCRGVQFFCLFQYKRSTVSTAVLVSVSYLCPIIIFLLGHCTLLPSVLVWRNPPPLSAHRYPFSLWSIIYSIYRLPRLLTTFSSESRFEFPMALVQRQAEKENSSRIICSPVLIKLGYVNMSRLSTN